MLWTYSALLPHCLPLVFTFLSLREGSLVHNVDTGERTIQAESALLDYAVEPDPAACSARTLVSQSTGLACNPQLGIAREALWRRFCNRRPFYTLSAIQRFQPRSHTSKAFGWRWRMAIHVNTGIKEVDSLLSRGGMASMLTTLWIIIGAVTFGTLLEEFNLLAKLINPILERAKTTGGLIAAVVGTALGLNIIAADQYIALVLPVRLYRTEFEKRGLKPQNLSRACCGCRNGDIAPRAVELVRRIHVRRARRTHDGVLAVLPSSTSPLPSCRWCWDSLVSR